MFFLFFKQICICFHLAQIFLYKAYRIMDFVKYSTMRTNEHITRVHISDYYIHNV